MKVEDKQVAIVGCGVVGATIAYELSQIEGLQVTVCDRGAPAGGSTGAALGVLMGAISQKKPKSRAWRLRQASLEGYDRLIPQLEAQLNRRIPRNDYGILKLATAEENWQKWQKLAEIRREQGFPLEIWSAAEVRSRFPQVGQLDGSGAVFSPRDRQIQPVPLTQALVEAAQQRGVRFAFGTTVVGADWDARGCLTRLHARAGLDNENSERGVSENPKPISENQIDASFEVDAVVLSAGLGSTPFAERLPSANGAGEAAIALRPVLGQALRFRLSEPFPSGFPVLTGGDVHIVPLNDWECWVGATVEFPDAAGTVTADAALLEAVREAAIALYPPLATAQLRDRWQGLRPRPEGRSAPVIDTLPGCENLLLATGHYRNGVLLAPGTAQVVRDWVTGYLSA